MIGKLHLLPIPLTGAGNNQLSTSALEAARTLNFFIAERAKTARRWIKTINHPLSLQEIEVIDMEERPEIEIWQIAKSKLDKGISVGIVSEAGMPCVADPGFFFVAKGQASDISIIPHAGPNAMLMALMASGFSGQSFTFHGYLPSKKEELRKAVIALLQTFKKNSSVQIFMETPYRNKQMYDMLLGHMSDDVALCIAAGIGNETEFIKTKKIKEWKTIKTQEWIDLPAIYLIGS